VLCDARRSTARWLPKPGLLCYARVVAKVINLNKYRKAKERADKAATAEQNRRKHGRSAEDKARENATLDKLERDLEGKRLVPDE
jgi:hypothetical protein